MKRLVSFLLFMVVLLIAGVSKSGPYEIDKPDKIIMVESDATQVEVLVIANDLKSLEVIRMLNEGLFDEVILVTENSAGDKDELVISLVNDVGKYNYSTLAGNNKQQNLSQKKYWQYHKLSSKNLKIERKKRLAHERLRRTQHRV